MGEIIKSENFFKEENQKNFLFQEFNMEQERKKEAELDSYEFSPFTEFSLQQKKVMQPIIKAERNHAQLSGFNISPIIKEYRGLKEQESNEFNVKVEQAIKEKLEELREKAYQEGLQIGKRDGEEKILKDTIEFSNKKFDDLSKIIEEIRGTKSTIIAHQINEIHQLILRLVQWIIIRELKDDGKYVERLLFKVIDELKEKNSLLVRVNKEHFHHMPEILKNFEQRLGEMHNVRIEVFSNPEEKGIIVESPQGIIDATLESQIHTLDEIFATVYKKDDEEKIE